ncbi:MAG: GAF domain-containing protein [Chloroflexi bacterium]|nr:GAF domain-containing protein [Chloroflexota bacterium]
MEQDALRRILHISRKMAETRTIGPLFDYAMDEAIDLIGAEYGHLVLLRPDGTFDFRVTRDDKGNTLESPDSRVSRSILNKAITSSEPVLLNDAVADPKYQNAKSVTRMRLRSVLCMPLISRGVAIGTLYLENRITSGCFSDPDLLLMTLFANQAAVLIENALLNDELEARVAVRTRELEQAMAHAEQSWLKAEQANQMQTSLLSNLAHDVRSPLGLVVTALSTILEGVFGELTPDQEEWIEKSLLSAEHAANLMNDVFELTKSDMQQLLIHPQDHDLGNFLTELYGIGLALPWPDGVIFNLDLDDKLPTLRFDPKRIHQVVLNLLSNAIKYTDQGDVTLYARWLQAENMVLIGVADTGSGIPQDRLSEVFERFRQVDDDPLRRQSGSGLGLAICRELVGLHGGRIWVESTLGEGADFKFTLPVNVEENEAV